MSTFDDDFGPLAPAPAPDPAPELDDADDDPLAAPAYDDAAPAVEDEFDESDGGFSDYERIVRIWIEDGRLAKVRLSPVWFHKVADGAALEARFRQALLRARLQLPAEPDAPEDDDGGEAEVEPELAERLRDLPALSRRSLALFNLLGDQMDERQAAADSADEPEPARPASGRSKGVTVTLSPAGMVDRIEFEPKWLDDAHVGSICTHIMIAADRAHARYEPADDNGSRSEEAEAERAVYQAALRTMLTPRSMRS